MIPITLKFGIMVIALAFVVVGMAMAEPGVPAVRQVQGLSISTTVIGVGNFNQDSNVRIEVSSGSRSLDEMPPLADGDDDTRDGVLYQSVYSEDTQNSGSGYITYDKDLEVSTGNKIRGEDNIKAVKQITYRGIDASSLITNDYLMVSSAGEDYGTIGENAICPFGSTTAKAPSFCNVVETGSNMVLKIANLNTQMGARFIMKSADPGIGIYNNVGVSSYAADTPSSGSVTAWIRGSVKEGGRSRITTYPYTELSDFNSTTGEFDTETTSYGYVEEKAEDLAMTMTFSDSTSMAGSISSFSKSMSYSSSLVV